MTRLLTMLLLLVPAAVYADVPVPRTAIVHSDVFTNHDTGPRHPEAAWRYMVILEAVRAGVPAERLLELEPRSAADEEVLLCHSEAYLELVKQEIASGATNLSTGDTRISQHSLEAALHAVGAVVRAVDAVFDGEAANAFCPVRPPGHHAERERGMGFCIFNNVAIGARYAQKKYDVERVLILDWDVHHGNGTEEIFYSDATVLLINIHQSPLYPGTGAAGDTGEGGGEGFNVNLPVPAGTTGAAFIEIFRNQALSKAEEFRPQLVMISAGFDALEHDPLGGLKLSVEDFAELTEIALEIASRHASGRIVSVLEGGYHPEKLGLAAAAHVRALARPQE